VGTSAGPRTALHDCSQSTEGPQLSGLVSVLEPLKGPKSATGDDGQGAGGQCQRSGGGGFGEQAQDAHHQRQLRREGDGCVVRAHGVGEVGAIPLQQGRRGDLLTGVQPGIVPLLHRCVQVPVLQARV